MNITEVLHLVEIVVWPLVAVAFIFVIRPHLAALLSGAKVKLSIAGQSIETTLPELKEILEEQAGESLSAESIAYLSSLEREGAKQYGSGITKSEERNLLRPLRNSGLVHTIPRNQFLQEATGIELSGLGRLYLRARTKPAPLKSGT